MTDPRDQLIAALQGALKPFAEAAERADEGNAMADPTRIAMHHPWHYVTIADFAKAFEVYSARLDPDLAASIEEDETPVVVQPKPFRSIVYDFCSRLKVSEKRDAALHVGIERPAGFPEFERDKKFLLAVKEAGRLDALAQFIHDIISKQDAPPPPAVDPVEKAIADALRPYTKHLVDNGTMTDPHDNMHLWLARRCFEAAKAAAAKG